MRRNLLPHLLCLLLAAAALPHPALAGGGAAAAPGAVEKHATAPATLDVNRATREELLTVPGVGPTTADAILALREEIGRFRSLEELLRVKGIGEKRLVELRRFLVAEPTAVAREAVPVP